MYSNGSGDLNTLFLRAIQPVVDVFWTLVWNVTGSTVTIPRPTAPTPTK